MTDAAALPEQLIAAAPQSTYHLVVGAERIHDDFSAGERDRCDHVGAALGNERGPARESCIG